MGELMCEVNWVSVLSDHLEAPPSSTSYPALSSVATQKDSHTMLVYLLYMLVFLAKEEQLLTKQVSPDVENIKMVSLFTEFMFPSRTPLCSACWFSPHLCLGTNWTCLHTRAFWDM